MYRRYGKRLLDVVLAIPGLILVSPLLAIAAISLFVANRGQVFFLQPRGGLHGRVFTLIKFKTMTDQRASDGQLLPDAERLTRIGQIIRKTSLDELLQLINVIKGDMSLIGPRPLLVQYLPLYDDFQKRRHEVRPGITGLAQVNGRNQLSWDQKFSYDIEYVDDLSLWLDLSIGLRTIWIILTAHGISSSSSATMEVFTGSVQQ